MFVFLMSCQSQYFKYISKSLIVSWIVWFVCVPIIKPTNNIFSFEGFLYHFFLVFLCNFPFPINQSPPKIHHLSGKREMLSPATSQTVYYSSKINLPQIETSSTFLDLQKLDGVGPVDNRPSTD